MRFGSLFSGIGGIDLGLERSGMECAWQVEINPFCRKVLAKHWPDVPRFSDIKEVTGDQLGPVDLVAGGFPCQDLSHAHTNGERDGLNGSKSALYWEMSRLVDEMRPRWVVLENVAQPWRRWVPIVRGDLFGRGYSSVPLLLSAATFGAPHKRPRVVVVANADLNGQSVRSIHEKASFLSPIPRGSGDFSGGPARHLRVDDGISPRVERLRALGNAVVPQLAEWVGRQIMEADRVSSS